MADVSIPEFRYVGFYYAEILTNLLESLEQHCDELTDRSDYEPYVQIIRAFTLAHHILSCELDISAEEAIFGTAKERESVQEHLKLISTRLNSYSPAMVRLVATLTKIFYENIADMVPKGSMFAVKGEEGSRGFVEYEVQDNVFARAGNGVEYCYRVDPDGTTTGNLEGAFPFEVFPDIVLNTWICFGHPTNMFDSLYLKMSDLSDSIYGSWEYYAKNYDNYHPNSVTIDGAGLKFVLTSLLGTKRCDGLTIRVRCRLTGVYEEVEVQWDGSNNYIISAARFGQAGDPSVLQRDYFVGGEWLPLSLVAETDWDLDDDENTLRWALPEDELRRWNKTNIGDSDEAFFVRYRITYLGTPPHSGTVDMDEIDSGAQYIEFEAIQGRSVVQDPLFSGTGLPFQTVTLARTPYIEGSLRLYIDEGTGVHLWSEVDNFVSSTSISRHFTVRINDDDQAVIMCGDGENGRTFPIGTENGSAAYRIGAAMNGNVSEDTVTENKNAVPFIKNIYNPQPAEGWKDKEGGNETALEAAKINVPAAKLRGTQAGASPDTLDRLLVDLEYEGTKPIVRVRVVEEIYGPKTIGAILVGPGGYAVPDELLSWLEDNLNGQLDSENGKKVIANHQLAAEHFDPEVINVEIEVDGGSVGEITDLITSLLNPTKKNDEGDQYVWQWGGLVDRNRIAAEAWKAKTGRQITKVNLIQPAADVSLGVRSLPVPGTITVTIVE